MNGGIKRPPAMASFGLPSLPDKPGDSKITDLGTGPLLDQYCLDDNTTLVSAAKDPAEFLQQTLGEVRGRIVDDPAGERVQEYTEVYFSMVDSTTPTDILQYESRVWRGFMKSGEPALEEVALKTYHRISQLKNFTVSTDDAMEFIDILLARIEKGDLDTSKTALIVYEDFLSKFFRKRFTLIASEVSTFRTMAQAKINDLLGGDKAHVVDVDMISHLERLLEVYAQVIFYDGVDAREIDDGSRWIQTYTKDGHPLKQVAEEVLDSLKMAMRLLTRKQTFAGPYISVQQAVPTQVKQSNDLAPAVGEIDTLKNQEKMGKVGKVPGEKAARVIIAGED